jgi:hypothetical protein
LGGNKKSQLLQQINEINNDWEGNNISSGVVAKRERNNSDNRATQVLVCNNEIKKELEKSNNNNTITSFTENMVYIHRVGFA